MHAITHTYYDTVVTTEYITVMYCTVNRSSLTYVCSACILLPFRFQISQALFSLSI